MMHNSPFALEQTFITERKFEDVLKETYSRLDGLEARLREYIADAIERFTADPADAVQWRVERAIESQTTLSILVEIRILINKSETPEAAKDSFQAFADSYRRQILAWATQGENSSSGLSNIASRITLSATAKEFTSFGLASDIEHMIDRDIEETKKRVVVLEFVDLKVEDHFRLSPDTSTMLFRKLSPRKAVECVYPINKTNQRTVEKRETVYVFREPLETDTVYSESEAD